MIEDKLREEIRSGRYLGVTRFPSDTSLALRFDVSRQTIVRVVTKLVDAGLLSRCRGSGTYLTAAARRMCGRIALVVPGVSGSEYFQQIGKTFASQVRLRGYEPLLVDVPDITSSQGQGDFKLFDRLLKAGRISGVVYQSLVSLERTDRNREIIDLIEGCDVPVVLLGSDVEEYPFRSKMDVVGVDNTMIGCRLAMHLIAKGAKRLAFVRKPDVGSVRDRFRGVAAAARGRVNVREFDFAPDNRRLVLKMMRDYRPDAIICGNDTVAFALSRVLHRMGARQFADVSLAGFDDAGCAQKMVPGLTTVRQPIEMIAESAVELLLLRMERPDRAPVSVCCDGLIVERGSTHAKKGRKP